MILPLGDVQSRLPFCALPLLLDFGAIPYLLMFLLGPSVGHAITRRFALSNDVHARNRFEQTPLHCAAVLNMSDRCRELIDMGADVHATDMWGVTPLGRAERAHAHDAERVIEEAATRGADPPSEAHSE